MRHISALAIVLLNGLLLQGATPAPVVNTTAIKYSTNRITITGISLSPTGAAPTVNFNSSNLSMVSFSNTIVVANIPVQQPGTYRLRLTSSNNNFYEFDVTYGAVGPQGPMGPQGPIGPTGAAGAQGPAG